MLREHTSLTMLEKSFQEGFKKMFFFGQKMCHFVGRFEAEFPQETNTHTNCSAAITLTL